MIPRVPSTNGGVGKSFTGTAAYLLHDENHAKTDERVMWTQTHNLATDDAEHAARIMAATAMASDHLKRAHHAAEQAKLPEDERSNYRASKPATNHVWHFSLSWSGEKEGHTLTREEMTRAALSSLRALGADHLQALIVAHDAETNPHVHVMVNRINAETGRTETPESNAKSKLSAWALEYEQQRGYVLCPNRERNAMFRDVGTRYSEQKISPQDYRARQSAAEEIKADPQAAKRFAAEQKFLDKGLSDATKLMQREHKAQLDALFKDHERRKAEINRFAEQSATQSENVIKDQWKPRFAHLKDEQDQKTDRFIDQEATAFGKARNIRDALKANWEERQTSGRGVLRETTDTLFNSSARLQALERQHEREQQAKAAEMRTEIDQSKAAIETERQSVISDNYERFTAEKTALEENQAAEVEANKQAWAERGQDRIQAWEQFAAQQRLESEFEDASGGDDRAQKLKDHEGEAVQEFQAAAEQDNYAEDEEEGDARPLTPQEQAKADQFAQDLAQSSGRARVIPREKVDKALDQKAANEQSRDRVPDLSED